MGTKTEQKTKQKPNIKKRILVTLFVLFNIAIILWTALSEFTNQENAAKLESVQINFWWLLPAAILFIVGISAEIYKYYLMMKKCCDKKDLKTATRTVLLGRYYDNITPAAVGGQPYQIYYMNKQGVGNGYSAVIPIVGMITTQLGFIIVAVISFLFFGGALSDFLKGSGWLGLIFYAIFPTGIMLALIFPEMINKIVTSVVKFLAKIRLVKDKEATIKKTEAALKKYTDCVRIILKNKKLFVSTVLLGVLFQVCICSIPFFVLQAFGGTLSFMDCFVTIVAITSTIYFVPTPGNAGAAESSFFFVFSSLTSGYVFWAMLVWRFFSYYIYIILGILVYSAIAYEKKTGRHPLSKAKKSITKVYKEVFKKEKCSNSQNI